MSPPDPEKARLIHMDAASCSTFGSSSEGLKPLIAPGTVENNRKYPKKRLYSKTAKSKSTNSHTYGPCFPSFSKASDVYNKRKRSPSTSHEESELPSSSSLPLETSGSDTGAVLPVGNEPTCKRKKKEIPPQSTKITSYLKSDEAGAVCELPQQCPETKSLEKISFVNIRADFTPDFTSEPSLWRNDDDDTDSSQILGQSHKSEPKKPRSRGPEYFGLFGATKIHEHKPDYFNKMPLEVMERIFGQLPLLDLLNCKRVCHLWNSVITNHGFMYWKMMYYKLKCGCSAEEDLMASILTSVSGHTTQNCLYALVRYMRESFSRKPAPDAYDTLSKHKKFSAAENVLKERFPDWSQNLSPWCIVTVLVLISEEVSDVSDIIRHLLSPGSQSLEADVLEVMYCIATFLLYSMNILGINHGLHYRVYYSLHTYENCIPSGGDTSVDAIEMSGQQTMYNYCTSLRLTHEQKRIVGHRIKPGDVIKVIAFAGSGKTSTLIELARRHPNHMFLNIMFNKGVCDYAKKIFPKNVKCQTAHSLAYSSGGKKFARRFVSKFCPDVFKQYLNVTEYPFEAHHYYKSVIITLQNFMASDDMEITMKHTPEIRPIHNVVFVPTLTPDQRLHVCQSAIKMWSFITDPNETCPVTHDVYLKLYQLSKPVIDKYQCIMVDEAQDCNPAMLDIVLSQKVPIILVGDPHQQIYGFRGSKNALSDIKSTHTYHLTRSFRFGPEIAYVASCCIEVLKNYTRETLVGSNKPSTTRGLIIGQYAIITRSNVGLFHEAIRLCCLKEYKHVDEPRSIFGAFVGGIGSYGLNQIEDIYRLKALGSRNINSVKPEERPQDKFIKVFQNFRSLVAYSARKDDRELTFKIELVLQYGDRIPHYMSTLRKMCSTPIELANVVFTTAHKAKGFEFDTVRLGDDYNIGRTLEDIMARDSEEEYNVMYVALTRAKRSLILTEKLSNVLLLAQEKYEYPVVSQAALPHQVHPNCVMCFAPLAPHTVLSLVRRKVTLTTGRSSSREGLLCMKCAVSPYYRPQVIRDAVIMYLDPMEDHSHRSLRFLVGPLPSDPPIPDEQDTSDDFDEVDFIYVINMGVAA